MLITGHQRYKIQSRFPTMGVTIIGADSCREKALGIIQSCYDSGYTDSDPETFFNTNGRCIIALDGEDAVGVARYKKDSNGVPLIDCLYVTDDSPDGTAENLLRSILAIAQNEGDGQVNTHMLDPRRRHFSTCYRMGFGDSGPCSCCQRDDLIHMNMRFRFGTYHSILQTIKS